MRALVGLVLALSLSACEKNHTFCVKNFTTTEEQSSCVTTTDTTGLSIEFCTGLDEFCATILE